MKTLPVFAVFQVPTTQSNQHTKAAYLGMACPELLQLYTEVAYAATLQYLLHQFTGMMRRKGNKTEAMGLRKIYKEVTDSIWKLIGC